MEKKKVGIVILNYVSVEETLECVESFMNQDYDNTEIVVVENGSKNNSAQVLCEKYQETPNVHVLVSDENLGFAKGNNLGINYARNTLNCDNVVVINSDTVVERSLVSELMDGVKPDVGVVSPTVINLDRNFQEPSVNADSLKKHIVLTYLRIFITIIKKTITKERQHSAPVNTEQAKQQNTATQYTPKKYYLQGCSYMLTEYFFEHYKELYPETFLYWEEINLLWYLEQAKLKSVYKETSPVLHKVAKSTANLIGESEQFRKKMKFVLASMKKSTPLFFMNYKRIQKKYNR